nr:caspase family protein [Bacteroidota bacterium]
MDDSDFTTESGIADGAITTQSTQTMRGVLPNPSGSDETYDGIAYLVINDNRIPLNVTQATSNRSVQRTIDKEDQTYMVKHGKAYPSDTESASDFTVFMDKVSRDEEGPSWVFEITFSINAGPNTLSIEVYDLQDTLFARLAQWNIVGAIEPSSMLVTLWWDTDETDIDLHVAELDESGDVVSHCYYSNIWAGDMVLDYDNTYGYGPEHINVDEVVGTKTYAIKVYYYADHHEDEEGDPVAPPTPTTAYVSAEVNAVTEILDSHTLTQPSTGSYWVAGDGVSVWDVGNLEVNGANVYTVTISQPDLSSYPSVQLTMDVADAEDTLVEGLTTTNIKVVNAGMIMSPVTVVDNGSGNYTLTYNDITAGARDLYVYVYVPPENEDDVLEGGLSNTVTYGTNYALLVGLNEYPPSQVPSGSVSWSDSGASTFVDVTVSLQADGMGDFSATLKDNSGVTNRPAVAVAWSAISGGPTIYRLTMTRPDNYMDYDGITVTYKKQSWLSNCVNDVIDMKASLKSTGTQMTNSGWLDTNIYTLTNSAATEAAITAKIAAIAAGMQKYDLFLFQFSGHGSNGTTDANQYLCAYEDANWISVTDLSNALKNIPNPGVGNITNLYVILDACHSGNFIGRSLLSRSNEEIIISRKIQRYRDFMPQGEPDSVINGLKFPRDLQNMDSDTSNLFVMTAVTGAKSSWDDSSLGNGVFTYYLLEGMNITGKFVSQAAGNNNHDCWLTAEEAFNYADPKSNAYVTVANGFPADAAEDPQVQDNSAAKPSRLIYNW